MAPIYPFVNGGRRLPQQLGRENAGIVNLNNKELFCGSNDAIRGRRQCVVCAKNVSFLRVTKLHIFSGIFHSKHLHRLLM
jgi:hypothetical protein